ncbi:MAG TPA: hypothetical protein PKX55_25505, partial [Leptospiraceae bacterium]|nr:hypothetical protein [Leptospiraceae bacterium]
MAPLILKYIRISFLFILGIFYSSCASMSVYNLVYPYSIKPDPEIVKEVSMDESKRLRLRLKSDIFFESLRCSEENLDDHFRQIHGKDIFDCNEKTDKFIKLNIDDSIPKTWLPILDKGNSLLDLSTIDSASYLLYPNVELYSFDLESAYYNENRNRIILIDKSGQCFLFGRHIFSDQGAFYSAEDPWKKLYEKEECKKYLASSMLKEIPIRKMKMPIIIIEYNGFTRSSFKLASSIRTIDRNQYIQIKSFSKDPNYIYSPLFLMSVPF